MLIASGYGRSHHDIEGRLTQDQIELYFFLAQERRAKEIETLAQLTAIHTAEFMVKAQSRR